MERYAHPQTSIVIRSNSNPSAASEAARSVRDPGCKVHVQGSESSILDRTRDVNATGPHSGPTTESRGLVAKPAYSADFGSSEAICERPAPRAKGDEAASTAGLGTRKRVEIDSLQEALRILKK